MRGERVSFDGGDGEYQGYLAKPQSGFGPGVVVLQEWWGLVDHIKEICDRFASEGFVALAPDLYKGESTKEPDKAGDLMMALNIAETEKILRKAVLFLLASPAATSQKVGIIGFCMGGQLAMYGAAGNDAIAACVNFYGIHPKVQPQFRDMEAPLLGIFASEDEYASPGVVKALDAQLTTLGKPHEFVTYPGRQHAFFNDHRPEVYEKEAAEDAWTRTVEFFRTHVK